MACQAFEQLALAVLLAFEDSDCQLEVLFPGRRYAQGGDGGALTCLHISPFGGYTCGLRHVVTPKMTSLAWQGVGPEKQLAFQFPTG